MKVAHVLRKYVPEQWGGTETAVKQLLDGLAREGVESVVFCPKLRGATYSDPGPLGEGGHELRRYRATLPVFGIPKARRRQLESVGGNLLSLQLVANLLREPGLSLVHSHVLNRIGGAALTAARWRGLPFVVSVHGGALDLPPEVGDALEAGAGIEWGKAFGALLRARKVLEQADAVLTVNPVEAQLLRERYPEQRVLQTFHGVDLDRFALGAEQAADEFGDRPVVLMLGRVDPVKNQRWVIERWREVLKRWPDAQLLSVGAATDEPYADGIRDLIREGGIGESVQLLGGMPPGDRELVRLLCRADVVVLPSRSETFGLAVVEAWASGAPVIASKTAGTKALIDHGRDGMLFDLDDPAEFLTLLGTVLGDPEQARELSVCGRRKAARYSIEAAAAPVLELYEQLIAEKRGRGVA